MSNFSDHIVNQRFRAIYETLIEAKLIKGKSEIAKVLGTYNHVVNSILRGQRNLTLNQLQQLFEIYKVDANYVFGLSEEMFVEGYNVHGVIPSHSMDDRQFQPQSNITLIPSRAMAGYALEHQQADYWHSLPKFSLPNMNGELIAMEISGDSMMPTITNGDIVVCEAVENNAIWDNHVYIVVTDAVVAKRVQQVKDGNKLVRLRLISDNDAVYKPYEIELEDIRQMLKVKCRLTQHAIS